MGALGAQTEENADELQDRVRAVAGMTDEQAQQAAWAALEASYRDGAFDYDGASG